MPSHTNKNTSEPLQLAMLCPAPEAPFSVWSITGNVDHSLKKTVEIIYSALFTFCVKVVMRRRDLVHATIGRGH